LNVFDILPVTFVLSLEDTTTFKDFENFFKKLDTVGKININKNKKYA